MSRGHPAGSLTARAHPYGSLSSSAHPDGSLTSKAHPAGTLVTRVHPPKAGGAVEESDDFLDACLDIDELYGLWTCKEAEVGGLDSGDVIMSDISENDRPDIKVILASSGNWQVADDSGPGGDSPSLTKYVSNDATDMGTTNFGALDSAITPIDAETDLSSGFVIYFMPSHWGNDHEVVAYTGIDTAPAGSAKTLMLGSYQTYMHAGRAEGGTSPQLVGTHGKSDADTGDALCGQWMFWAWWNEREGGDEHHHYSWLQEIGSKWGTDQTAWNQPQGSFASLQGGLRFGYGSSGTIPADCRWAAFAIFSTNIDEDAFEEIYKKAGFEG